MVQDLIQHTYFPDENGNGVGQRGQVLNRELLSLESLELIEFTIQDLKCA